MKRIKILYDAVGWAYYNNATQIKKYAPKDWVVDIGPQKYEGLENYDLIFQFAYCYLDTLKKYLAKKDWFVPIITSYNVGVGYNPISVLKHVVEESQGVVINNYGMYNTFGKNPKTTCIPNGVNLDIFNVTNPIENRKVPKVLWISSKFHKRQKGYETFALPLKKKLEADGIQCDFRLVDSVGDDKMTQQELAKWYNNATVYVVTALHEGTPNPALESAACGCTVVATPVGNMPELIINSYNGYITDWNVDTMYRDVKKAIAGYELLAKNMQPIIQQWTWKDRSKWYYNFFDKVLSKNEKERTFANGSIEITSPKKECRHITLTENQSYEIFAYCSKNYSSAISFSVPTWLKEQNVSKVTLYTDWYFNSSDPKLNVIKYFDEDSNWVTGCARRLEVIKQFSDQYKNSGKNILFMDIDCYLKTDVSEVFKRKFDVAITRLDSKEEYTNGTATDGLWFARMTPGYDEFINAWMADAERLKSKQDFSKNNQITYTQYSFTRAAKIKMAMSTTCNIINIDEHIYNSEHSDINKWFQDIVKYKPKILHFKGRRFTDLKLVNKVLSLYDIDEPHEQPSPVKPKKQHLNLWRRTTPVVNQMIIKRG